MAREITGSRCLPARRPVGGERTASGRDREKRRFLLPSESNVWHRETSEDEIWVVFGAELDCGKLWRGRSLGAGVYQPQDPWEVRDRLLAETGRRGPSESNVWHRESNLLASLLGARTLLGAPGRTTRNKKLLEPAGVATRSKDTTRGSWPYY